MSEGILSSAPRATHRMSWLESRCRSAVIARLAGLRSDAIRLHEGDQSYVLGAGGSADPNATLRVTNPQFWPAIVFGGTLGGAEAWMEGWWDTEDLPGIIRLLARNREAVVGLNRGLARFQAQALRFVHWRRSNSRRGSRQNIAAHYDLGNGFFRSFLDPSMTYSSALFAHRSQSLEDAQAAKYERLCHRLGLAERHRLLEIGTGWGGFALYAARTRGCHVTTTTISEEQHRLTTERVRAAGLGERVTVLLRDYRDLEGRFDRLVSIEMVEAVGHDNLATYFRTCSDRLETDGAMAIQAILHRDQDYERSLRSVDFIKRYIFPGGQLPSVGSLIGAMGESTDLRLTALEDISAHYAETLRRWRERLTEKWEGLRQAGLSEKFLRMWAFYFAYCEGGFDERVIAVSQIVFEKPRSRLRAVPSAR